MKMSQAMKNEIKFLEAFLELTKSRGGKSLSSGQVLKNFKFESNKLVKNNQISAESLALFIDRISLDSQIEEAENKIKEATAERNALRLKQNSLTQSPKAPVRTTITADPCASPANQSHC